jgi:SAM-dependent methyltransferase
VTERGPDWTDGERVDRWVARDAGRRAVQTARELAAAIVALDTQPALVLELAAGAGTFLAAFLRAFPGARGLWSDSSPHMARHARATLAPFAGRVDYLLTDLRSPGVAATAAPDVLICARVTHGLDGPELAEFYRGAAGMLAPGGWLVNLDHVAAPQGWSPRYDALTPRFYEGTQERAAAAKERGGHTVGTHLDALSSAGLVDADTPWRLLSTVLLLARRPGDHAQVSRT